VSATQQYIVGALLLVALAASAAAKLPLFQKELRRSISLGLALIGLLTIVLSLQVLVTGLRLRAAALVSAQEAMVAQWNGLILGAIVLLLVSGLAFFFALGVFIWSLLPPAGPTPGARPRARLNPFDAFESPQTINPLDDR
jgi:hypothetical protein